MRDTNGTPENDKSSERIVADEEKLEEKLEESDKTDETDEAVASEEEARPRHGGGFPIRRPSSHRGMAAFLLFMLVVGLCGMVANSASVPQGVTQRQQDADTDKAKQAGGAAKPNGDTAPRGKADGDRGKGVGTTDANPAVESHIQQSRLRREIEQGRTDVRIITSGDLESGVPYEAVNERRLPYVAYPADDDGEGHVDTVRVAAGHISFDMPCGFWLVSDAESDNPAVKTFIRNDELGVTIGVGRANPDGVTAEMTIERWEASARSPFAHSGTRYSRKSKGGNVSGLVWRYVFDDTSGKRRLVAGLEDGSKVYVEVMTEPWPAYERDESKSPHVARWIHEFVSSIQVLDGTIGDGTK